MLLRQSVLIYCSPSLLTGERLVIPNYECLCGKSCYFYTISYDCNHKAETSASTPFFSPSVLILQGKGCATSNHECWAGRVRLVWRPCHVMLLLCLSPVTPGVWSYFPKHTASNERAMGSQHTCYCSCLCEFFQSSTAPAGLLWVLLTNYLVSMAVVPANWASVQVHTMAFWKQVRGLEINQRPRLEWEESAGGVVATLRESQWVTTGRN